jgi:hypothetical protein
MKDAGPEHDAPIPLRYPVGANQLRSEVMPDEILTLGHHEFIQRVQEIEISPLDRTGLLLRLCASVEVHSTEPPGPGRHRGATTVAIRMDRSAATTLFQQIREIFQKMGCRYRQKTQAKPRGIETRIWRLHAAPQRVLECDMVRHCRIIDGRLRDLSLELAMAIRSADYLAQMLA